MHFGYLKGGITITSKGSRFFDILWIHYLINLPEDEKPMTYARFIIDRLDWTPTHPDVLKEYTLKYYTMRFTEDERDGFPSLKETIGTGEKVISFKTFCDDIDEDLVYYELLILHDEEETIADVLSKITETKKKSALTAFYYHDNHLKNFD